MSKKYYLVDTENVGDRWFDMPQKICKKDRVITFYTEHHSKQLEKYFIKQVHNPKILWLECAAGNNALDYQLVGVLSYLIAKHPKASFYIYSNDKDYQDTVDFWKSRGIKICQKGFEITQKKKGKKKKAKAGQDKEVKLSLPKNVTQEATTKKETAGIVKLTEEQYVTEIAKSLPITNLSGWYQALIAILGQERGREWYLKIRDNAEWKETFSKYYLGDEYSRGVNLVTVALNVNNLDVTRAEEAYKIIQSHNRKNVNAMKADFDKQFGKKPRRDILRYFVLYFWQSRENR